MKRGLIIALIILACLISLVYANQAPVIDFYSNFTSSSIMFGETRVFYVIASDADGDNLSYEWYLDGVSAEENSNVYSYLAEEEGNYIINVEVSDENSSVSKSWSVSVIKENYEEAEEDKVYVKEWYWAFLITAIVILILVVIFIIIWQVRKRKQEEKI